MFPARRKTDYRTDAPSDLRTVVRVSWRHKGLLALGILAGLGVAAALVAYLPPVFQSTAQVLVVKKRPDAVTGVDTRQFAAEEYMAPAQELIKSALIVERAIQLKHLHATTSLASEDQDLADVIRKGLIVTPVKSASGPTNVFKLAFRGGVQEDGPVVLTAILDSFKDFLDKKYQTVSADTLELILREKETLQRDLTTKEAAYRQFRERHPLIGKGKDGTDVRRERLNSIQAKRSALLLQRVELESQLAAVEAAQKQGRSREAVLAMLAEFSLKGEAGESVRIRSSSLQEQLFALLMEERKVQEIHGPEHPEVSALRKRIDVARQLLVLPPTAWAAHDDVQGVRFAALDAAAAQPVLALDAVELHVQVLKQKSQHIKLSEELLVTVFQAEHEEAGRVATLEFQEETLSTNIGLAKQLHETLVKRLGEVSLIRNVGGYELEALEPPSLARKVAPSAALFLLLGGIIGSLVGLMLAYWADMRQSGTEHTIRTPARALNASTPNGNGAVTAPV